MNEILLILAGALSTAAAGVVGAIAAARLHRPVDQASAAQAAAATVLAEAQTQDTRMATVIKWQENLGNQIHELLEQNAGLKADNAELKLLLAKSNADLLLVQAAQEAAQVLIKALQQQVTDGNTTQGSVIVTLTNQIETLQARIVMLDASVAALTTKSSEDAKTIMELMQKLNRPADPSQLTVEEAADRAAGAPQKAG